MRTPARIGGEGGVKPPPLSVFLACHGIAASPRRSTAWRLSLGDWLWCFRHRLRRFPCLALRPEFR